jgi:DNA repair photolyase
VRLATGAAARRLGLSCSVFLMPVLPYLTDTTAHLDSALAQIKEADASAVLFTALHLRQGAREWYFEWLRRNQPQLVPRYLAMYGSGANAPKEYRTWLAAKIKALMHRHGLQRGIEDPATGGVRSAALGRTAIKPVVAAPVAPTSGAGPTLF